MEYRICPPAPLRFARSAVYYWRERLLREGRLMSHTEIVGLVLFAVLTGAIVGFSAGRWVQPRRHRDSAVNEWCRALVAWSCAWKEVSRTYLAFVAAHRASAAEPEHSPRFEYRCDEVLRARMAFHRAQRDLDRALARLMLHDPDAYESFRALTLPPAEEHRNALNGSREDADRLAGKLGDLCARADAMVLGELQQASRGAVAGLLRGGIAFLSRIGDRLASAPGDRK